MTDDRRSFAIAANRLPVRWNQGEESWETSPGGLVSALTPILRERDGVWVGWTGLPDHEPEPFVHEGILQRPVRVSEREIADYYRGFCNATLWPLYHNAIRTPEYHRHWWQPYVAVNRRFADALAESLAPDGTAWVHDYHMQLLPGMLRDRLPDARLGFFLHIPFPPVELFGYLPWRREVLRGLLAADVLAFQTQQSVSNFAECAVRYVAAERVEGGVAHEGRFVRLQWAPIAVDTGAFERLARSDSVREHAASIRRRMGRECVLLGVDRLDYTKGIAHRLKAIETFYERYPETAARCAVLQIAVPTREKIADYADMRDRVERLVSQINGQHGRPGETPITYVYRSLPVEELVACYVAADVMMVTPLCDGMNLVAQEFVAAQAEGDGVLVLSDQTGAHDLLGESAVSITPQDTEGFAESIDRALSMPTRERRERMGALAHECWKTDVSNWIDDVLGSVADLRERGLVGRV